MLRPPPPPSPPAAAHAKRSLALAGVADHGVGDALAGLGELGQAGRFARQAQGIDRPQRRRQVGQGLQLRRRLEERLPQHHGRHRQRDGQTLRRHVQTHRHDGAVGIEHRRPAGGIDAAAVDPQETVHALGRHDVRPAGHALDRRAAHHPTGRHVEPVAPPPPDGGHEAGAVEHRQGRRQSQAARGRHRLGRRRRGWHRLGLRRRSRQRPRRRQRERPRCRRQRRRRRRRRLDPKNGQAHRRVGHAELRRRKTRAARQVQRRPRRSRLPHGTQVDHGETPVAHQEPRRDRLRNAPRVLDRHAADGRRRLLADGSQVDLRGSRGRRHKGRPPAQHHTDATDHRQTSHAGSSAPPASTVFPLYNDRRGWKLHDSRLRRSARGISSCRAPARAPGRASTRKATCRYPDTGSPRIAPGRSPPG